MNWIRQFVILFAFTSGLVVRSSEGTRSRVQSAERFEFCVARNLSESSIFNEADKVRMSKIVMETDLRMHGLKADPRDAGNAKTMLRLFAAALACVAADCDSSVRPQREQACLTALEACAKSLPEPIGDEIIMETKKIFFAMNREISTLDAISKNSASVEAKKRGKLEESKVKKSEEPLKEKISENIRQRLEESKSEKKEHPARESEVKGRPKRAPVPAFRYEAFSTPLKSNPTLDSIIAGKLLNSATFNNFFTYGLSQEDAVFFSRAMVSSGLGSYRYDIIDEAKNAVTNSMYRLGSFAGSQDYAYAIGRSIAAVLAAHELTFYADGLGIGSSLVYQLDTMLGSDPSPSLPSGFGTVSVSSSVRASSSAVVSSQIGGMAPVPINPSYVEPSFSIPSDPQSDKNQFQSSLSYFLLQSEIISGAFCSGPVPNLYEVMNSAFADNGYQIASTIATVVSNSLTMLPTDAACTQYADVISEIVADIFDKNGLILTTDPEIIANKISDSISAVTESNPPQNPSGFGQQTFSGSEYELNPSFTEYSYPDPKIPASPEALYPDSGGFDSPQDTPTLQLNPMLTNSTEFSVEASPPVIQTSAKQNSNLPLEISSDGVYSPEGTSLSVEDVVATNNSRVIADYPRDVDQTNKTSDFVPPIIFEPGPVIPERIPENTESAPKSKEANSDQTPTPETIEVTKAPEITTPSPPPATSFQPSTATVKSEEGTTSAPQVDLKDAFESKSKLSEFLLKELSSSLKALNVTSGDGQKIQDTPETSRKLPDAQNPKPSDSPPVFKSPNPALISPGSQDMPSPNPTGILMVQEPRKNQNPNPALISPGSQDMPSPNPTGILMVQEPRKNQNPNPAGIPPNSQDKPPSTQTVSEVQPSVVTPLQQNRPPDMVPLTVPKPIEGEVSALLFAEKVSSIVTASVRLIRSQNFQFGDLCSKLNELAPLVDLPPLDVCSEIPLIDYMLHVLNAVTYMLAGER